MITRHEKIGCAIGGFGLICLAGTIFIKSAIIGVPLSLISVIIVAIGLIIANLKDW